MVRVFDPRKRLVRCQSSLGDLVVEWCHEVLPSGGEAYDVELEIPSTLEWGIEICLTGDSSVIASREAPMLVGTLTAIDELRVAEITFREGSALVETRGEPPPSAIGRPVELRPPTIRVYPYDL